MIYSKEELTVLFGNKIRQNIPGKYSNTLARKVIINNNGYILLRNKTRELFNVTDNKMPIEQSKINSITLSLLSANIAPIPGFGTVIANTILLGNGVYVGDFYLDEDSHLVSLLIDLLFYSLNGMTSEAYSIMNLISNTKKSYDKENRLNIKGMSRSDRTASIKPLEI